jgi:SOS-response transcriptional repressor LexA
MVDIARYLSGKQKGDKRIMATEKPKTKKASSSATNKTSKKKVAKKATTIKKSSSIRVKPKTAQSNPTKQKKQIAPEKRIEMIRTAAYYLAEKRGYYGNNELGDWFEAEKQVDSISS